MLHAAAAFLALGLVPFVGQEMFERDQEKGAELSALGGQTFEIILLEKPGEERLRKIFGIFPAVAAATNVGVKRIPVSLAKIAEGEIRLRRRFPAGGQARGSSKGGGVSHRAIALPGAKGFSSIDHPVSRRFVRSVTSERF